MLLQPEICSHLRQVGWREGGMLRMMRLDDVQITPPTLLRERNVTSYHNTRGLRLGEAQAPCKPLYVQDGDTICLRVGGLYQGRYLVYFVPVYQ